MKQILLLEKQTIDQIAAGEVVERPASVVKELVENALDAGASAVTVEIRDGGKKQIRVTDNGEGIPADQIGKAFMRHATSKIRQVEDLETVSSLGFRGEALSSIAAVARVECITKTRESLTGTLFDIEGGTETLREEIGAPNGTTFVVRDLFYNTPARSKFLLSAASEGGRIRSSVEKLALSHPQIAFTFIADGRTLLVTSGNGKIPDIVYQIYGKETAKNLVPFETEQPGMRISGFLGTAQIARGNRSCEIFFVNQRSIQSEILAKAVEEGYHGFLMQHRYPFVILYLEIDGSLVDVNVHPAKREVRFSDNEAVFRPLCLAVKQTLLAGEHIPEAGLRKQEVSSGTGDKSSSDVKTSEKMPSVPEPFEERRRESLRVLRDAGKASGAERNDEINSGFENPVVSKSEKENTAEETFSADPSSVKTAEAVPEKVLSPETRKQFRLIGQVFDTYWLMEYRDQLYIVDQHAAHEKVLYEKMMKQYREKTIASQMIFPAAVIEPGPAEAELIRSRLAVFEELGFEIEEFGGNAFKISAVPANLYKTDARELFRDILDQFREEGTIPPASIAERLASMSCKAAVKGNSTLSAAEAESLLDELLTLENPYHCPHGRPTIITMTREELEKSFRRIV